MVCVFGVVDVNMYNNLILLSALVSNKSGTSIAVPVVDYHEM